MHAYDNFPRHPFAVGVGFHPHIDSGAVDTELAVDTGLPPFNREYQERHLDDMTLDVQGAFDAIAAVFAPLDAQGPILGGRKIDRIEPLGPRQCAVVQGHAVAGRGHGNGARDLRAGNVPRIQVQRRVPLAEAPRKRRTGMDAGKAEHAAPRIDLPAG